MSRTYTVSYYLECGDIGGFSSTHVCEVGEDKRVKILKSTAHTLNGDMDVTNMLSRMAIDDVEDLVLEQHFLDGRVFRQIGAI